jgi:hypothetical protein
MPHDAVVANFLAKYTPEIAAQLQAAREHLAKHFPRGFELVYDNYNALAFAFSPSERASDAILSVAGYSKWVTLFFAQGTTLPNPANVLEGTGSQFRSVRLLPPARLTEQAVQQLIRAAKEAAGAQLALAPSLATVIKSVSAKQQPRLPASKKQGTGAKPARPRGSGA